MNPKLTDYVEAGDALTPEQRQPKSYRELFQFLRPLITQPPSA